MALALQNAARYGTHESTRAHGNNPTTMYDPSTASPTTGPSAACHGLHSPSTVQDIHFTAFEAGENLYSDRDVSAAIAMPRVLHCPSDGGESGLLALLTDSQPIPSSIFGALPPPPLCRASCKDAAPARTASKCRDGSVRPAALPSSRRAAGRLSCAGRRRIIQWRRNPGGVSRPRGRQVAGGGRSSPIANCLLILAAIRPVCW